MHECNLEKSIKCTLEAKAGCEEAYFSLLPSPDALPLVTYEQDLPGVWEAENLLAG